MRILAGKEVKTGLIIQGECVMLDRNGTVYPCIDHLYHPNPGTANDGYSEIERTIDWLYANQIRQIQPELDQWLACRTARQIAQSEDTETKEEVLLNVMYSDLYEPCAAVRQTVSDVYDACVCDSQNTAMLLSLDETEIAGKISAFLNESFLRVRAGGKKNPEGTSTIYFRISSHDFDWRPVILGFLWDVFRSPIQMPQKIWIGHDEETNPPESVLFEGNPTELVRCISSLKYIGWI